MIKSLSLFALAAVFALSLWGCGTCPLAQYDTNNDGRITTADTYDAGAYSATMTSLAADPLGMLTCSSYLSGLYPFSSEGMW